MRIDVFTLFPEYLAGPLNVSLVGARARTESSTSVCTIHASGPTTRTAPSTTVLSAAEREWC